MNLKNGSERYKFAKNSSHIIETVIEVQLVVRSKIEVTISYIFKEVGIMGIPVIKVAKNVMELASKNSSTILAATAIVGVGATVFGAIKATPKAIDILKDKDESIDAVMKDVEAGEISDEQAKYEKKRIYISFTKDMIKCWWPVALSGTITIVSIIGGHAIDKRRQAALAATLSLTESKLKDYREKVTEVVGENKEQKIRDEMYKDKVFFNQPKDNNIISTGKGDVLCYDAVSGRYFTCNADFIRNRVNVLNQRLLSEMWISLNDLYYELNLPSIKLGDDIGWNISNDGLIDVDFSSQLTDDEKPVLVLDYTVEPRFDYRSLH